MQRHSVNIYMKYQTRRIRKSFRILFDYFAFVYCQLYFTVFYITFIKLFNYMNGSYYFTAI